MDNQRLWILSKIILFLCLRGILLVNCGGITSVPNKSGMLNGAVTLTCSYSLQGTETFDRIVWSKQKSDSSYVDLATIDIDGSFLFYQNINLKDRSNLTLINNVASIYIDRLVCTDEAKYRCKLDYVDVNIFTVEQAMSDKLTIQALPEKPSDLEQEQTDVVEFDDVTFKCTSIIGKSPTTKIQWQKVAGNTISDLTEDDSIVSTTPGSCTQTETSTLILNVSRVDNGKIVRCRTTDRQYLDSSQLRVYYPIDESRLSVYQTPDLQIQTEGTLVKLKCNVITVPQATYIWRHMESDTAYDVGTSGEKTFDRITKSDEGTYRCEAENSYLNTTSSAIRPLYLVVEKKSIPASTTSPTGTDTSTGLGGITPGGSTQRDDKTTLIIIIVCVVAVVVIVAVIILVVIFRRRRNNKAVKIEVPSEKPYNNNPAINSFATQPDLVHDEKKKYNQSVNPYSIQNPYSTTNYSTHNNSFDMRSDDLSYGELNFDDRPRSRKPVALSDADYADISMPRV